MKAFIKLKYGILFLLIIFLISSVSALVIVQNHPIKNEYWVWDGLFIPPNIIKINGYVYDDGYGHDEDFNEYWYKKILVHEYAHYLCYNLFDDMYCNDENWKKEHKEYRIKI